jgi:hypothetical protein
MIIQMLYWAPTGFQDKENHIKIWTGPTSQAQFDVKLR